MARRVVWTRNAQSNRLDIFKYWDKRNKSKIYSQKLNSIFISAADLLSLFPRIGRLTTRTNIRVKVVKNYLMVYKFSDSKVWILAIFDTRQDPDKLKTLI